MFSQAKVNTKYTDADPGFDVRRGEIRRWSGDRLGTQSRQGWSPGSGGGGAEGEAAEGPANKLF